MNRRRFLTLVGTSAVSGSVVGISGCLGQAQTDPPETTTDNLNSSTPSPKPTADLPSITNYPFRFGQSITFPEGGVYGWFFDGSFTKSVDTSGSVTGSGSVSAYVTEENLQEAKIPSSAVKKVEDVTSFNFESIEVTDGNGTVLMSVDSTATMNLSVEVTEI
ncbi:hypothetical protein [Halobacterium wangiae]|uniref:hypothetical protein n=1 Tax=Halobacterium wangiae TaxID=2902623 RepID=UPI001E4FAED3|nr:hypothetical protein [Halobacterium wangiae]